MSITVYRRIRNFNVRRQTRICMYVRIIHVYSASNNYFNVRVRCCSGRGRSTKINCACAVHWTTGRENVYTAETSTNGVAFESHCSLNSRRFRYNAHTYNTILWHIGRQIDCTILCTEFVTLIIVLSHYIVYVYYIH